VEDAVLQRLKGLRRLSEVDLENPEEALALLDRVKMSSNRIHNFSA
jgi:hypothetical protein